VKTEFIETPPRRQGDHAHHPARLRLRGGASRPEAPAGKTIFAVRLTSSTDNTLDSGPAIGTSQGFQQVYHAETTVQFADYFNETIRRVEWSDLVAETKTDIEAYERTLTYLPADKSRWLISLPDTITEKSIIPDGRSQLRKRQLFPNATTGLVDSEIQEPSGDADQRLQVSYTRNADGLVSTRTETDNSGTARKTTFTYDSASGTFLSSIFNPLGHQLDFAYHPGLGLLVGAVDPNGC
jgi:hypothetical protein